MHKGAESTTGLMERGGRMGIGDVLFLFVSWWTTSCKPRKGTCTPGDKKDHAHHGTDMLMLCSANAMLCYSFFGVLKIVLLQIELPAHHGTDMLMLFYAVLC